MQQGSRAVCKNLHIANYMLCKDMYAIMFPRTRGLLKRVGPWYTSMCCLLESSMRMKFHQCHPDRLKKPEVGPRADTSVKMFAN
eukprot:1355202-Amphidinium_carterae.1